MRSRTNAVFISTVPYGASLSKPGRAGREKKWCISAGLAVAGRGWRPVAASTAAACVPDRVASCLPLTAWTLSSPTRPSAGGPGGPGGLDGRGGGESAAVAASRRRRGMAEAWRQRVPLWEASSPAAALKGRLCGRLAVPRLRFARRFVVELLLLLWALAHTTGVGPAPSQSALGFRVGADQSASRAWPGLGQCAMR